MIADARHIGLDEGKAWIEEMEGMFNRFKELLNNPPKVGIAVSEGRRPGNLSVCRECREKHGVGTPDASLLKAIEVLTQRLEALEHGQEEA